jgi:hypothetical protein
VIQSYSVTLPPAQPRDKDRDSQVYGEGSGCVWLWAFPELLLWDVPIAWLFCSVTGSTLGNIYSKPGDLWGVDALGNLLVVEAKSARLGRLRHDPFRDFIHEGASPALAKPNCTDTQAGTLLSQWTARRTLEQRFMDQHLSDLLEGVPLTGKYPGLLPYSFHRAALGIWRTTYEKAILPAIADRQYGRTVGNYLDERERQGNPVPHFFGLLVTHEGLRPSLSPIGKRHRDKLAKVAPDRVHLRVISSSPQRGGVVITGTLLQE